MNSRRDTGSQSASARALGPGDPSRIGAYVLEAKLGEGGMGAVYLGRREGGPQVAVKVVRGELAGDPAFLARFRDEVTNAQRVASFCTAQVLDHGQEDGRAYMVTEYIEGPSLLEHVSEHGALSPGLLNGVAVGVAAALLAIHSAGLVHRDLKPSNVLLSISGPRVIDFGIARALDEAAGHTRTGQVIGSPGWIAPEQILNQSITPAVDVFAWGCLVAFAGSGRNPFGTGTFQVMAARVVHAEPEIGPLSEPLAGLVRRALDKDPANRPTAQELLLSLAGGGGEAAVTTTLHEAWPEDLAEPEPQEDGRPDGGPAEAPHAADAHAPAAAGTAPAVAETTADSRPPVPGTRPVHAPGRPSGEAPAEATLHVPQTPPSPLPETRPAQMPGPAPVPMPPPGPRPSFPPGPGQSPAHAAQTEWMDAEAPTGPAARGRRGKPLLATVAGVVALTAAVAVGLYALQDDGAKRNASGSASGPPTDTMLVRVDYAPGWAKECHARVGSLTPGGTVASARELLPGEGCDVLPQWSPDRKQIAFTRWDGGATSEVWVMNADGSGPRRVVSGIAPRSRVAWSPEGDRIAAMVKVGGVSQLHVADVRTGRTVPLTDDPQPKDDPTWSRENGKIAFWSRRDGSQQLYCLDPEHPDRAWTQVTTSRIAPNGANDPIWSPDGDQLAFTLMNGEGKTSDIAVVDADGDGYRQLTTDPAHEMDPSWSPDGTWLAFVRGPVPMPQIWAMPVDRGESGARQIGPSSVGHPAWS
ncbi:Serine/threonine protein kinase [Thermomonospora echinospora]|uniref:Serine/threonine protein kinase n=1 Tax=Thermomonospora echinospora TaxID=1992 RepID=A0A1H6D5W5_9ACTN|nr:protein kinase [Thermomonospora echinospora]SEG80135.1 Serine/threonine protein kinase [Thermomonospora echinospora]